MSPAAPGGRFGDVTSAHIVRGQFARIERRRIPSGWARMARAGMDSVALGSHYASRARLRAGRVRAAVRDPSRGGPAALLDPDSPASSPPELGSTHSELAGALVLTVHAQTSRHAVMAQYEHANRALWTGGTEPCLWSPARRTNPGIKPRARGPATGDPRLRALPVSRHRIRIGKLIHHPLNNLHTTDFSGSMASSVSPMESSRTSRSYAS